MGRALAPLNPVNDAGRVHLPDLPFVRAANSGALSIFIARCENVGLFRRAVLDFTDDGVDVAPDMHRKAQIFASARQSYVLQLHELDAVQSAEGRLTADPSGILGDQVQKPSSLRLIP
ncbi:hypothetical protein D3C85_1447110 [compost metagenome]